MKQLPVTNLAAENSFGCIDIALRRLLTTSVRCVSDRLMIRSAGHAVFGTSAAREVKKLLPEVEAIQKQFDDDQKKQKIASMTALTGKVSLYEKKKLEILDACKQHGGPFTKPEDIDHFQARCIAEGRSVAYQKKAYKAEVVHKRETFTKCPKTNNNFRIRCQTTKKDLTPQQLATNLKTLLSNIMAIAEVPNAVVKDAIQKAVVAAGIDFILNENLESEAQPSVDVLAQPSVAVQQAAGGLPDTTCLVDSPNLKVINDQFFLNDFVAIATVDSQAKKTWSLGMIDDYNGKDIASVSFFKPVPGRMGENRVAFFGPEEEEEIDVPTNSILPLAPSVNESVLNGEQVFIIENHEEIDELVEKIEV